MKLVTTAVDAGGIATGKKRCSGSFLICRWSSFKIIRYVVKLYRALVRCASVSAPIPPIVEYIIAYIRVDRVIRPSAQARVTGSILGK